MLHFSAVLIAFLVAGIATAAPTQFNKRIDQQTSLAPQPWEAACKTAGGGDQCNQIAVNASATLLAAAGDCDQQNSADSMVSLGKQLNSPAMTQAAQIFAQQPRNSPDSLSVPYCQQAPQNQELNGLFQCQFQGTNPTKFANGNAVGGAGTIPFGQTTPVNPPGSCPANTAGPIAAGAELSDSAKTPGVPTASGAGNNATAAAPSSAAANGTQPTPSVAASGAQPTPSAAASAANASAPVAPAAAANSTSSGSAASNFHVANGQAAQALNKQFQTLTADSPCTGGQQACVNGQFGQCVNGKFQLSPCAGGEVCTALPLVNKAGTSVTCDLAADATARISTALGGGK